MSELASPQTGTATGAARPAQAFHPKVVLGLLLFGAIAFFAMLYFIGAGNTGGKDNNGGAHAASRGLTGYAALAQLLEAEGHEVKLSRNAGALTGETLLILTPPMFADGDEIARIIEQRRYKGPTILVLPKWVSMEIPKQVKVKHGDGWVILGEAQSPGWVEEFSAPLKMDLSLDPLDDPGFDWRGMGASGKLPDAKSAQGMEAKDMQPLVTDSNGRMLVAYLQDSGTYPVLDEAAGIATQVPDVDEDGYDANGNYVDTDRWGVVVVAEPDLFDNYGMADRSRAELAGKVVEAALEGQDLPITFDLTLNGLGRTQNLLTLAFEPPFLAATLCLIIAMLIVGWRAFRRFGPPLAEARAIAFGKGRLVANSAGFILRTRRLHLLTGPYAAMLRARIVQSLGLRRADDEAIDAALLRRRIDTPPYSHLAAALETAHGPREILRAALALKSLERMLSR
ncbi:MAG: DUF4350 domain-containing protein [Sphingomonadales bacterium]|nr:DUF4350 domain-containing protein [Sphingomonadales bacterium]MBD3772040.1 DUF4350 domain-containing protein [Paracoccaceae bacterium]